MAKILAKQNIANSIRSINRVIEGQDSYRYDWIELRTTELCEIHEMKKILKQLPKKLDVYSPTDLTSGIRIILYFHFEFQGKIYSTAGKRWKTSH